MGGWRLYISAGCFVGVTVVKLLFPSYAEEMRNGIVSVIDMDMDYSEAVQTVGTLLTDEAVQDVLLRFKSGEDLMSAMDTQEVPPLPTVQCIVPEITVTPSTTEEPKEAAQSRLKQAMEAFHAAQEAYAAYDTPASVSYDLAEPSFAYTPPVDGVCSSGFGYRVHPIENRVLFHYGTDYEVVEGTAIAAFADGQVTAVGEESGYGKYLEITHADGWKTLYAHCSEIIASPMSEVKQGEVVAYSGQTGRVTGPHLHFELTHKGMYTNPEFYFYEGYA